MMWRGEGIPYILMAVPQDILFRTQTLIEILNLGVSTYSFSLLETINTAVSRVAVTYTIPLQI